MRYLGLLIWDDALTHAARIPEQADIPINKYIIGNPAISGQVKEITINGASSNSLAIKSTLSSKGNNWRVINNCLQNSYISRKNAAGAIHANASSRKGDNSCMKVRCELKYIIEAVNIAMNICMRWVAPRYPFVSGESDAPYTDIGVSRNAC